MAHYCGGQVRTLGTPAQPERKTTKDGELLPAMFHTPAVPANPNKCPACGTVVVEVSKAGVAIQARSWDAATITEHAAKDPALLAAINADKAANPKAWGL